MSTIATQESPAERTRSSALRLGTGLMTLRAAAFVGYAVIFFVLNFTHSFLELGIGRDQVSDGKANTHAFSPSLYNCCTPLHTAVSGSIAVSGRAVVFFSWFGVRRGQTWAWVGAVAAPVLGLAVALPAHSPYGFDTIGLL